MVCATVCVRGAFMVCVSDSQPGTKLLECVTEQCFIQSRTEQNDQAFLHQNIIPGFPLHDRTELFVLCC